MNIATAGAEARIHHQWMPDKLSLERGISPDTLDLLLQRGQNASMSMRTLGRVQSIQKIDNLWYGATDTRRPGGWVATW